MEPPPPKLCKEIAFSNTHWCLHSVPCFTSLFTRNAFSSHLPNKSPVPEGIRTKAQPWRPFKQVETQANRKLALQRPLRTVSPSLFILGIRQDVAVTGMVGAWETEGEEGDKKNTRDIYIYMFIYFHFIHIDVLSA